ncbi:MAG: hypothetical protein GF355_03795 [Candidatus Eisenbacteria bacterium]|nr:hypothetical protein [Candidatus Eisenbacteria bacterium]
MTTAELIVAEQDLFIAAVANLDGDQCEEHSRAIIRRLGEPTSFETYLYELTRLAISIGGSSEEQITQYFRVTKRLFPGISPEDDVLGRLTSLMMKMMAERLKPLAKLRQQ